MPGSRRDDPELVPEFYLGPAPKGRPIDREVRVALEQLWPWFWRYVGRQLEDQNRAPELLEMVADRVSGYIQSHPGQVRSMVGLCRVTTINLIKSIRTREARIEYVGSNQNIEASLSPCAQDWQEEVEMWIWVDEILHDQDRSVRTIFGLRALQHSWKEIGKLLGISADQARQRLRRALSKTYDDVARRSRNRGRQ
jgi:DNA-directed RNA polymerase specialized sigma24 family protein